jgi:hypothetical protein
MPLPQGVSVRLLLLAILTARCTTTGRISATVNKPASFFGAGGMPFNVAIALLEADRLPQFAFLLRPIKSPYKTCFSFGSSS